MPLPTRLFAWHVCCGRPLLSRFHSYSATFGTLNISTGNREFGVLRRSTGHIVPAGFSTSSQPSSSRRYVREFRQDCAMSHLLLGMIVLNSTYNSGGLQLSIRASILWAQIRDEDGRLPSNRFQPSWVSRFSTCCVRACSNVSSSRYAVCI